MTTDNRKEFYRLIERANRIGARLPERIEDVEVDDPMAIAELRMILAEFNAACDAIKTFW